MLATAAARPGPQTSAPPVLVLVRRRGAAPKAQLTHDSGHAAHDHVANAREGKGCQLHPDGMGHRYFAWTKWRGAGWTRRGE
jgi:hypothetical protein